MEALIEPEPPTNLCDLDLIRDIGENTYEVNNRGTTYMLRGFMIDSSVRAEEMRREIEIMKKLDHPNVVRCHQVFSTDGRIFLLLEHMDGGCLVADHVTTESGLTSAVHQVLLGLGYLHQNKISHGDVQTSNIFINSSEQVKVLYVGKILSGTEVVSNEIGNIHDEFTWDVCSVGVYFLKLFQEMDWVAQLKPSLGFDKFIGCCMQTDVSNRWTALELLGHPFLKQFWSISKRTLPVSSEAEQISPEKKRSKLSQEQGESSEDVNLRRCIQHCVLFFPDSEFEKSKLVQMWIAEECIKLEVGTKRMEDVGDMYFDELVRRGVILPSSFDKLPQNVKYKVIADRVSGSFLERERPNYTRIDECNVDEIGGEALHLTWHGKSLDKTSLVGVCKKFNQLRTLLVLVDSKSLIKELPYDMFLGLKLLKTLDLSHTQIAELPSSIGLLESLRLLDVSETPIKELPESTDHLQYLQTLRLGGCFLLCALPSGLGCLINLRHLDLSDIFGRLERMPRAMGNLTKLQTLHAFIVGKEDRCGIGEISNMNDITGSFCISRLENVSGVDEAKEAALSDKRRIEKLELRWNYCGNDDSYRAEEEVLKCLQPPFEVKELQLTYYCGLRLPSWISDPSFPSLATITLSLCINCDMLPSLGELPSLKILHILGMKNLRDMNTLFCRRYETQGCIAFPKLETLMLQGMLSLEEWTGIEDRDFPCLSEISIRCCPKLSVLPSLSLLRSLRLLEISYCMQLMYLPEMPRSLESLILENCPKMHEWYSKDGGRETAFVKNILVDFEIRACDI